MRKEKILELARGFDGKSKNCNALARTRVEKGLTYQFADRRAKKGRMRRLWVQQMNAGSREHGLPYGRLVAGLARGDVLVNRKVAADLAKSEPLSFRALVEIAKLYD